MTGLGKVWDGLDVVSQIVTKDGNFHIAAPMEFRFVKGGDTAMSGTFTEDPEHTWFVNLDLIGFVEANRTSSDYPAKLLQFFADVERKWVEMRGFPTSRQDVRFLRPDRGRRAPTRHRSTRTSWPTFAGVAAHAWRPSTPTARASIRTASSQAPSRHRAGVSGVFAQKPGLRRAQRIGSMIER